MNTAIDIQSTDTALAQPLAFSVPLADLSEFSLLPEARRTEVQFTLPLLARLHALRGAGNIRTAAATIAATARHQMRGCSAASLLRKYYLYLGAGCDWRTLVGQYKGPATLPEKEQRQFDEFVKKLAEDNQRSMGQGWEALRELWQNGHAIPGYGTWIQYYSSKFPDRPLPKTFPRGFYPAGWSKRNLYRKAPNKGARVLFQRGIAAAKRHFPSIARDPSGLRPMEQIVIDDFVLDCNCAFPGDAKNPPQIAPVAGLLAKCVGTRRNLTWGLGAQILRNEKQPDGTIKQVRCGIRRVDVQVLLHDLFEKFGLPDYTVTILCENATASIAPELELALSTLFEGRVRVERTGLINHKTLTNGFTEKGGKPWEKGWIESSFNWLWNKLGAMPGYKGSNARLNGPADIDAKINYTKLLLGQGEGKLNLPPEKIVLLRLPFPSPQLLEQAFSWACHAQDARTEHKYLGFDQVTEFLLEDGGEPQPFTALALLPSSAQQQVQVVERMESPLERWARLSQGVTFHAIPPAVLALLLLTPKKVTYRNHAVTFTHDKAGFSYVDEAGTVLRGVQDGTEFLGYVDLKAPEQLHLADLKGAYVGTLNRLGGRRGLIDLRDKEALADAAAVQATIVNRTIAEVRERHADQDAQLAIDRDHNAAIVEEHKAATEGFTTAQKIAGAAGENAARAFEQQKRDARAARPVSTQAASKGLADLVNGTGRPEPAAVPPTIAEREEGSDDAPASLSDIT
jgi:hypothetical protein